jgi:hypothetical protein
MESTYRVVYTTMNSVNLSQHLGITRSFVSRPIAPDLGLTKRNETAASDDSPIHPSIHPSFFNPGIACTSSERSQILERGLVRFQGLIILAIFVMG